MQQTNRGHKELRKGRYSGEGYVYLLTAVTLNRYCFFADHNAARAVSRCIYQKDMYGSGELLCWVVMPDHIHLLVKLGAEPLAVMMNRVKSISAIAINKLLLRRGQLWARAYHDHAIRSDEDIKSVARYIICNPVRAGLVNKPGDYPYWHAVWL